MHFKDARALLGVPINATVPQVKAAYKKKALENHPDRFPPDCKSQAEARFKLISEAYTCLRSVTYSGSASMGGMYRRGRQMPSLVASIPFALLIVGTVSLGFSCAASAYRKQQQESPARHPFLP
ncbi:unnamed protein product [Sphagnum troendelagicum]|uniref:J domain-containing protein n=3 Tax=Sphagnum TaxID=13804 RepID=A0ABP0UZJ5_9BRYO